MTTALNILIIGGGQMGSAIALGFIRSSAKISIIIVEPDLDRRIEITDTGIIAVKETPNPITSEVIILATPPHIFPLLSELHPQLQHFKGVIVSVMAGVSLSELTTRLNRTQVFRSIPNLACSINQGTTLSIPGPQVTRKNEDLINRIFSTLGTSTFVTEEHLLDSATALVGGGPAYISYFTAALIEYAKTAGFDNASATSMVIQILRGTSALLEAGPDTPMRLCEKVMTPGGTTQKAINHFNHMQIRTSIVDGLKQSFLHSVELGRRSWR